MFGVADVVRVIVSLVIVAIVGYALLQAWTAWQRRRAWMARAAMRQRLLDEGKVIGRYDASAAVADVREETTL